MTTLSVRRPGALALMAALALATRGTVGLAQDSSRAVRITLDTYTSTKPGVIVLPVTGAFGDSVRAILQRDLGFGDRVDVKAEDLLVVDTTSGAVGELNFPLYARLGAAFVVQPAMTTTGVRVAVHVVSTQKAERARDFPVTAPPLTPEWRMQVHGVSDAVEVWLTGTAGIAASRILYTSGGRVWQIDSDGANATSLTAADPPAAYPAWHPLGQRITYTVMTEEGRRIVVKDLDGGTRTLPALGGSVNTSPVFSMPDGSTLMYAFGLEAGTDIYAVPSDALNTAPRRVTVSRGMNSMSPSHSPDGRRIVYVSDRPGHPELYIADADGTNAELLTSFNFGDQSQRTDPAWSPDGRLIAFQAEKDGLAQIHTINPRDRSIKQYTSQLRNEDPAWAPDSRHIVFTSNRSGSWQLWVLDIESNRVRQLTRAAGGAKAGAWSPRLLVNR